MLLKGDIVTIASGANPDPEANTFEIFLSDLHAKARQDGAGSSNQLGGTTE